MRFKGSPMSSEGVERMPNLLQRPRQRLRMVHSVGCAVIALSVLWCAFGAAEWRRSSRIDVGRVPTNKHAAVSNDAMKLAPKLASLDLALFDAPLWVVPPRLPEPEKPPVPVAPPPLRLQFVGIEVDPSRPRAILFDPDAVAILRAAVGEAVGAHRVRSIDASTVVLESADRRFSHRLEVKQLVSLAPGSGGAIKEREAP